MAEGDQGLVPALGDRRDQPPQGRQLGEQGARRARRGGVHRDRLVGRLLLVAERAVADDHLHAVGAEIEPGQRLRASSASPSISSIEITRLASSASTAAE